MRMNASKQVGLDSTLFYTPSVSPQATTSFKIDASRQYSISYCSNPLVVCCSRNLRNVT